MLATINGLETMAQLFIIAGICYMVFVFSATAVYFYVANQNRASRSRANIRIVAKARRKTTGSHTLEDYLI